MKKAILYAVLALTAASSWAFYPKADEPTGCMMIISNPSSGFGYGVTITTVAPDGTQSEQSTKIKRGPLHKPVGRRHLGIQARTSRAEQLHPQRVAGSECDPYYLTG